MKKANDDTTATEIISDPQLRTILLVVYAGSVELSRSPIQPPLCEIQIYEFFWPTEPQI